MDRVRGSSPPLLLLLLLLPPFPAQDLPPPAQTEPSPEPSPESSNATLSPADEQRNETGPGRCLVDAQMGLLALGSAGGLVLCLLVAVATLACQVHHLQRRVYIPRSSRSNLDLVGNAGYWANAGTGPGAAGGLEGPCDTSVMLEEVTTRDEDRDIQESGGFRAERLEEEDEEEEEEGGERGAGPSPEEKPLMQTSESRELSSELPHDLENMPLVV